MCEPTEPLDTRLRELEQPTCTASRRSTMGTTVLSSSIVLAAAAAAADPAPRSYSTPTAQRAGDVAMKPFAAAAAASSANTCRCAGVLLSSKLGFRPASSSPCSGGGGHLTTEIAECVFNTSAKCLPPACSRAHEHVKSSSQLKTRWLTAAGQNTRHRQMGCDDAPEWAEVRTTK